MSISSYCPDAYAFTVSEIRETAGSLNALFERREPVTLDLCGIREVDVSGLQLLIAARRSAERTNNQLSILASPEGPLAQALVRAGFLGADGVPRNAAEQVWEAMLQQGAPTP